MKMQSSPSKTQRVLVEQESRAEVLISAPAWYSLARKAGRNDTLLTVLEQVYVRGIMDANPYSKNTPEQQAFQRVESFLHKGKAYKVDEDLIVECPDVPDGKKHMGTIKNAIKKFQSPKPKTLKEGDPFYAAGRYVARKIMHSMSNRYKAQKPPGVRSINNKEKAPATEDEYVAARKYRMGLNQRAKDEFKSDQTQKKLAAIKIDKGKPAYNADKARSFSYKQSEHQASVAAGHARGETYGGDPPTPEQKAGLAARQAAQARNANSSKTYDPNKKKPKPAFRTS